MLKAYVHMITAAQAAKERGAVASEYAVLLALIAVLLVTAVGTLRGAIEGALTGAAGVISN